MKANRKFLRGDDEAVSPVIAVILMVAITVVLAATVYVWVSGFGSNSNSSPAHTLSIVSAGSIVGEEVTAANTADDLYWKNYTVTSADPGLTYADMKVVLGGSAFTWELATGSCAIEASSTAGDTHRYSACAGNTPKAETASVLAGDTLILSCYTANADCLTDKDLFISDKEANSIMVTLKVR